MSHVHLELEGDVAVVRIDRPPANAMDQGLLEEGLGVLDDVAGEDPAAVVLTGTGRFFSGGLDLNVVPGLDAAGAAALAEGINRLFAAWHSFPRPVVCAVNGHAVAGGMILALCGDLRVASSEAALGLTEVKVGVPYPEVAMQVVRAELGPSAARRLALGSDLVDAATALRLGAVDEVVDPGAVLGRAMELARGLAGHPGDVYAATKRTLREPADGTPRDGRLSPSSERHTRPVGAER